MLFIVKVNQGIKEGTLAICQGKALIYRSLIGIDSFKLDYDEETLEQQELPKNFLGKNMIV